MTAQDAARLKAEIENDLRNLDRTLADIESRRAGTDDTTTYALALLLMNYYTGAEHIFQRIAALLGGLPPSGDRWHVQLLEDMALEIASVRPAVLQRAAAERLMELLKFRHAVRNLYAWTIRRAEMEPRLAELAEVHGRLATDLARFAAFLDSLAAI